MELYLQSPITSSWGDAYLRTEPHLPLPVVIVLCFLQCDVALQEAFAHG